jgi:uncharacterized protein YutE (UPF0331/DUF86 family)
MKYNGVIQRKFALLDKYLLEIQKHTKDISLDAFMKNKILIAAIERYLQIMVEVVIDVAERVLAIHDAGPAATANEAIEKLVKLTVLKSPEPYTTMIKFRNVLVHEYEEIDPKIIFEIVSQHLDDFRLFRNEIDNG